MGVNKRTSLLCVDNIVQTEKKIKIIDNIMIRLNRIVSRLDIILNVALFLPNDFELLCC
jgi:hypothetical protein